RRAGQVDHAGDSRDRFALGVQLQAQRLLLLGQLDAGPRLPPTPGLAGLLGPGDAGELLSRDTNLHAVSGHEPLRTEPFTPERPEQLRPLAYPSWTRPSLPLASRALFPAPAWLQLPCFLRPTRYLPFAG